MTAYHCGRNPAYAVQLKSYSDPSRASKFLVWAKLPARDGARPAAAEGFCRAFPSITPI
jgi:hypothetical protein